MSALPDEATRMVEKAHERQLAMRYEVSALEAAVESGRATTQAQYEYALEWLARYTAKRVMQLSADAARAHDAADPAAPSPPNPLGAAGTTTRSTLPHPLGAYEDALRDELGPRRNPQ